MSYDQRKLLAERTHAQGARAISELLSAAVRQAYVELSELGIDPVKAERQRFEERRRQEDEADADEPREEATPLPGDEQPIYVPERGD
jgi:hypothetical protein